MTAAGWRAISDEVARLREYALRAGDRYNFPERFLRGYAAELAIEAYRFTGHHEQGILINVAALALSTLRGRLVIHRVSDGAARLVRSTELRSMPGEPPHLLRAPWIVEARRPDVPLFGDTSSLAGYPVPGREPGAVYLIGLLYPEGARGTLWRPRWEEHDVSKVSDGDQELLLLEDTPETYREWTRAATRFAVVFAALMEADATPLRVSEHKERGGRRRGSQSSGGWRVERRVYISDEGRVRMVSPRDQKPVTSGQGPRGEIPERVRVAGHLKRQPYGPGRQGRRWIYVDSYEATRWVSKRPLWVAVQSIDERRRKGVRPGTSIQKYH